MFSYLSGRAGEIADQVNRMQKASLQQHKSQNLWRLVPDSSIAKNPDKFDGGSSGLQRLSKLGLTSCPLPLLSRQLLYYPSETH